MCYFCVLLMSINFVCIFLNFTHSELGFNNLFSPKRTNKSGKDKVRWNQTHGRSLVLVNCVSVYCSVTSGDCSVTKIFCTTVLLDAFPCGGMSPVGVLDVFTCAGMHHWLPEFIFIVKFFPYSLLQIDVRQRKSIANVVILIQPSLFF